MNKSAIEYLAAVGGMTWNPIAMRCDRASRGCNNCWHLRMARRLSGNEALGFYRQEAYLGGPAVMLEDELHAPDHRLKPTLIAVEFMGDLFHHKVRDEYIDKVFEVMRWNARHRFLVLTKRSSRMKSYMMERFKNAHGVGGPWPPKNVWMGVSVEDQMSVSRILDLTSIPGIYRWVSFEPLIEHVAPVAMPLLDWVVVGAETGPGRRPMEYHWARELMEQCEAAGRPFFGKVWSDGTRMMPREFPKELRP